MKLNEFISNVLLDIDEGIKVAREKTDKSYYIDSSSNDIKGVHFDIAVTTSSTDSSQTDGGVNAGIIKIFEANVNAKLENINQNSEVSRIQFTIYVPTRTSTEETNLYRQSPAKNDIDFSI